MSTSVMIKSSDGGNGMVHKGVFIHREVKQWTAESWIVIVHIFNFHYHPAVALKRGIPSVPPSHSQIVNREYLPVNGSYHNHIHTCKSKDSFCSGGVDNIQHNLPI